MSTIQAYTTANRPAASASNVGLTIFNTTDNAINVSDGTNWRTYNSDASVQYSLSSTTLSVDFDSTSSEYLNTDYATTDNTGFTYSAYIKSSTTSTQLFIDNYQDSNSGQLAFRVNGSGQYLLYYKITTGTTETLFNTSSYSASDLLDNAWHHLALTISGTTVKIYEDGSLKYTTALSNSYVAQSNALFRIGSNLGESAFYNGLMDEVAFFERALTSTEISQIYNNQNYSTPACHFRMGDGGSDTDSSGEATAGEAVVTINDFSVNSFTATQTTAANKPSYSSTVPTF
jgi:hypothetical protein